jgi:MFS family permease
VAALPKVSAFTSNTEQQARRNARLYLVGLAASLVGNSAMSLVAGIWVKSLTGSSAQAGLVSACVYAPSLAGPLAGMLADRVSRQRLLVCVNAVSAGTILTLLAVRSARDVWVIFVAMAAYGIEVALIDPAESALFAEMLPAGVRMRINGWRLGLQELGRLGAPLLGAGLFALLGGGAVAALDASTFLLAAGVTGMLRFHPAPIESPKEGWVRELTAGVRHIWVTPQLRAVVVAATAAMAVSGIGVAAQYSMVAAVGERPAFLGVFMAALGAGSAIAALISGRLVERMGERRLAMLGLANFAIGCALRASDQLAPALAGWVILGFALPWVYLAALNLAQRLTPNARQGRVTAAITLLLFGPQAPMQALGALLIGNTSYRVIYLSSAAITALAVIWLAVQSGRRGGSRH